MSNSYAAHIIIGISLSTPHLLAILDAPGPMMKGPILGNADNYLARLLTAIDLALEDVLDDPTEDNIETAHEQLHKIRAEFVPASNIIGPAPPTDHDRLLLYAEDIILSAIKPYLRRAPSSLLSIYIVPAKGRVDDGGPEPGTVLFGLIPDQYISDPFIFSCLPLLATKYVTSYHWITTS